MITPDCACEGEMTTPEPLREEWDLESVYDEKISPLMSQIIAICKEHKLPMLASFAFARNEEQSDFCTTFLQWDGRKSEKLLDAATLIRRSNHSILAITIGPAPKATP